MYYSPSVTFGLDHNNNNDIPLDVFIYIKGESILPDAIFQQATRDRNIKTLYYYSNSKEKKAEYDSLEDITKKYKEIYNMKIHNLSTSIHTNKIEENTFFKLFVQNEYAKDCYITNKTRHFENILETNGFIKSEEGVINYLEREKKNRNE